MRVITIKIEIDDSARPLDRGAAAMAVMDATPQIKAAIANALPDSRSVNRRIDIVYNFGDKP